MKRLFFAIALVAVNCLSMSAYATDSKKESNSESMSACAIAKPKAPERQGWREDIPLYGDVESVAVTKYKLEEKSGEVVRGDIEDCEKYFFNQAGDVIERDKYDTDGSLDEKTIYKYDASGNMIEETVYSGEALLPDRQTVYEITYRK